ncbi:MAG: 30S ribosomal protein S8 [Candidatus Omnitrophica bacterium]|nr:30S ribosomal protein S8 [Candidatus Omnitrophota bacterium]
MAQNDILADGLTQVRNAIHAGRERVTIPCSRTLSEVIRVLKEEGYILNYRIVQDHPPQSLIRVQLKPQDKANPPIQHIARVSKSSRRVYAGYGAIPAVLRGMGISILSTPKGIMTHRKAKQLKVGGEILCKVY